MAWYAGAERREIRPGASDPPIKVIGAILHVDAGNNSSLYNYFNGPSGGIESHFHVPKTGLIEQYRDTGYEADANYKANSFYVNGKRYGYVSIETQGYGGGEWNAHQLTNIKSLLLWLSRTHGFPLRLASGPQSPGVGWHSRYPSWSPVAKSCPGPDRIRQIHNVLVPWFSTASTPTTSGDEDMAVTESDLAQIATAVANRVIGSQGNGQPLTMGQALGRMNWLYEQWLEAGGLNEQADAIQQAILSVQSDVDDLQARHE